MDHFDVLLGAIHEDHQQKHQIASHADHLIALLAFNEVVFGYDLIRISEYFDGRLKRNSTWGKATAFALTGDESHNSDYIRTALTGTLVDEAGLSIDFTDEENPMFAEIARSLLRVLYT